MEGYRASARSLPLRGTWHPYRIRLASQLRSFSWTRRRHHLPKLDRDQRINRARPSAFSSHDSHLSSILDHPLFRVVPTRPQPAPAVTPPKTKGSEAPSRFNNENISDGSLVLLDELIARGKADHTVLHRCLQQHIASSRSQPAPTSHSSDDVSLNQAPPEVIDKINAWYSSTPWEGRRCFFDSRNTLSFIMSLLVYSQKQEIATTWLLDLHDSCSLPCWLSKSTVTQVGEVQLPTRETCFSNVMGELITAQLKHTRNIQGALEYFLRICDILVHDQKTASGGKESEKRSPTRRTISTLAGWIANNCQTDEVKLLSPQVFEGFLVFIKTRVGSNSSFLTALLSLYHPLRPDPTPAVLYTKQKFGELHPSTLKSGSAVTSRNRQKLLRLSLEAASLCLQEEKFKDSQWFLSCARASLGPVGDDHSHQRTVLEEPMSYPFSIERLGIVSH